MFHSSPRYNRDMLAICIAADKSIDADWRSIGSHLRGATIDVFDAKMAVPPTGCQAVAFVGAQPVKRSHLERVVAAGKHVLLATEPCLSESDWQALSNAAQKSGVQFAVVNPDRYLPSRQLIRQQPEQKIGELGLVRVHRWVPAAEWDTLWGFPSPVVRDIEITMWLTGQTPQVVCVLETSGDGRTGAGRVLQIHLGFSTGMALIDVAHLPA